MSIGINWIWSIITIQINVITFFSKRDTRHKDIRIIGNLDWNEAASIRMHLDMAMNYWFYHIHWILDNIITLSRINIKKISVWINNFIILIVLFIIKNRLWIPIQNYCGTKNSNIYEMVSARLATSTLPNQYTVPWLNISDQWNGRRGSIEWPSRSPDLKPLDSGYVKGKSCYNYTERN